MTVAYAREYRTATKEDWGPGPWQDEPDKAQWVDEATGLDCLIVRNQSGALCGYVGVPNTHPWHGIGYGQCLTGCDETYCSHTPGSYVEVHGGLTFADACDDRPGRPESVGICHLPLPGRPHDVWWFGFDCNHAWDLAPAYARYREAVWDEVYRTQEYVQSECATLAQQLAESAA